MPNGKENNKKLTTTTRILTESYAFGPSYWSPQDDYATRIYLNAYETASFVSNIMITGSGNNGLRWAIVAPSGAKLNGAVNGKGLNDNTWVLGTFKVPNQKLSEKFHTISDHLNLETTNHQFLFSVQNDSTAGYVWISGSRGGSSGDYRVLTGSFIQCITT